MTIALTLLGGCALLVMVLALTIRRRITRISRLVFVLAVAAVGAGSWLVVGGSNEIVAARAVKKWPIVRGTVLQSEIIGNRAIRPVVFYQYRVGDSTYQDSSSLGIPSFGNRRVRRDESEKITAEFRIGDTVKVHYDPTAPGRSTLFAREDWSSYLRLSLGMLLFGAGLFFVACAGSGRLLSSPA